MISRRIISIHIIPLAFCFRLTLGLAIFIFPLFHISLYNLALYIVIFASFRPAGSAFFSNISDVSFIVPHHMQMRTSVRKLRATLYRASGIPQGRKQCETRHTDNTHQFNFHFLQQYDILNLAFK